MFPLEAVCSLNTRDGFSRVSHPILNPKNFKQNRVGNPNRESVPPYFKILVKIFLLITKSGDKNKSLKIDRSRTSVDLTKIFEFLLVNRRGRQGRVPPLHPIAFIFMQFSGTIDQVIVRSATGFPYLTIS